MKRRARGTFGVELIALGLEAPEVLDLVADGNLHCVSGAVFNRANVFCRTLRSSILEM